MKEPGTRRRFSGSFKAKVALEALREQKTTAQLSSEFGCHPSQIAKWKKEALEGLPHLFGVRANGQAEEQVVAALYEHIGRLKMELEWFKKKFGAAP